MAEDRLAELEGRLAEGDSRAALEVLRVLCREPDLHERVDRLQRMMSALAELSERLEIDVVAEAARVAAEAPYRHNHLYELGYELLDARLAVAAVPVLRRALEVRPHDRPTVAELSAALQQEGRHQEVVALITSQVKSLRGDKTMRCLLAFNAILGGDLKTALKHRPQPVMDDPELGDLPHRVFGMLERAAGVSNKLHDRDLRGWHYVLTGGVLTLLSPYGYPDPMCGRYAMVHSSPALCRAGLLRARAWLEAANQAPTRVLYPADQSSEILARAAAALWDVPVAPLDDEAGVVVVYDIADLDEAAQEHLARHRPGQVLYAHATCWTDPAPFVADITTVLYQFDNAPWHDEQTEGPLPELLPEQLADHAASIVAADDLGEGERVDEDDMDAWLALVSVYGARAAARRTGGPRDRLWRSAGPVQSSRF